MVINKNNKYIGGKDSEISQKIIKEPLKFPNNVIISKAGKNLIEGLLEKHQSLRIDISSQLFDEWFLDTE